MDTFKPGDIVEWWTPDAGCAHGNHSIGVVIAIDCGLTIDWISMSPELQERCRTQGEGTTRYLREHWLESLFRKIGSAR